MNAFKIVSDFSPKGDQPKAIEALSAGLKAGKKSQVLLGVTGSGKTFTMAGVIEKIQKPALVMAPNKTLAAQLYHEFKTLFPENRVEYFVSYYDYYQPEAYIPATDTYIWKDSSINEMIDKMRHSATRSVLSRRDVVVVASVSCIYGIGAPEDYLGMRVNVENASEMSRERLMADLVSMQYERNDIDFHRGVFRVRGDRVEIFPAYEEDRAIRIEFFGDEIEGVSEIDPLRGTVTQKMDQAVIFPASHYVTPKGTLDRAVRTIVAELKERIDRFRVENRLIEAQRVEERVRFDLEMMLEIGYCSGIENYSRHLTGRKEGEPPPTLLDYFPDDFVTFIDESHIAVPQLRGMHAGDRSRKKTLVRHGFRLPSALDNRPLKFEETRQRTPRVVYVSATPGPYEMEDGKDAVVDLIVRPTGLLDPRMEVRPAKNQVDDLFGEIQKRAERNERTLTATLTKKMAEDLSEYYSELGVRTRYLHSDIGALERMDIIRDLRMGKFDTLIGINLLREGLDIPEVSLVAVLDADREGFLRDARSLIQTGGRASRNVNGRVILYADSVTRSMRTAMDETGRRRAIQREHNRKHGVTPMGISKKISPIFDYHEAGGEEAGAVAEGDAFGDVPGDVEKILSDLEKEMRAAAKALDFETAARLRDQAKALEKSHSQGF
ncbi:excinulease of nucleotide excision repair, DNA damage recognition component [Candidatus Desulfarcum epimagneticum]|uniref:UvrABC system protein B n=1 Tax=uncultured Desulfobacteraceae bacterium TaxID=218296 RepID=A0A484HG17_9BACT|nr:excinulease of nucleotide excision repair, DNA damage recognition component [uncultured Desulfobacteraceae bacterium]